MTLQLETIAQYTHAINFVKHAATVENTFKEMMPTWEKLLSADGSSIIIKDTMTRAKAQLVQLYARDLMKYVRTITGLTMFPIAQEDIKVGNWRVDSIILQLASNDVKSHRHLFELMMTNIYCVPSIMFEYGKKNDPKILAKHLEDLFQGIKVEFDETSPVSLEVIEQGLLLFIEGGVEELVLRLN